MFAQLLTLSKMGKLAYGILCHVERRSVKMLQSPIARTHYAKDLLVVEVAAKPLAMDASLLHFHVLSWS